MYFHLDEVADEVASAGVRARLCGALFDNSGRGEQLLRAAVDLHDDWHGKAEGRVTVGLAPHSTYLCSAPYLHEILREAKRLQCGLHVHVAETEREVAESRERYGMTPVQQLAELGCFGVPTVAAHGIYVDAADCRLLREGGVSVAHNPGSNLKLANGIAPVQMLLDEGVNVSLGTDGAASNNNLNLFEEMHLAALLQKWLRRDAEALPARQVLRMATIRGAEALGLDDFDRLARDRQAGGSDHRRRCPAALGAAPRSRRAAGLFGAGRRRLRGARRRPDPHGGSRAADARRRLAAGAGHGANPRLAAPLAEPLETPPTTLELPPLARGCRLERGWAIVCR